MRLPRGGLRSASTIASNGGTETLNYLAIDPSKRSCGWAYFADGAERAQHGTWTLGGEFTSRGQLYYKFYATLLEHRKLFPFDRINAEEPVNLLPGFKGTSADNIWISVGMAATLEMFCHTFRIRLEWVPPQSWRRHFIGKMPRGSKSKDLKDYAIERARQLGFSPRRHDEAEALGILDHMLERAKVMPPWRADEVLRPALGGVA